MSFKTVVLFRGKQAPAKTKCASLSNAGLKQNVSTNNIIKLTYLHTHTRKIYVEVVVSTRLKTHHLHSFCWYVETSVVHVQDPMTTWDAWFIAFEDSSLNIQKVTRSWEKTKNIWNHHLVIFHHVSSIGIKVLWCRWYIKYSHQQNSSSGPNNIQNFQCD